MRFTIQKRLFTGFVIATGIAYIIALYVMLFRGFGRANVMLSEDMRYHYSYNLVPFKTILDYIGAAVDGRIRGHALWNLIGNLFLLFPLGFYLPFFSRKMSSLKVYAVLVAAFIVVIEVAQLVTMSGTLDIDDFILNFAGALLGFFLCKVTPIRSLFMFSGTRAEN